jgi:uncharacterized repeat protein (TIGR02543 family)
MRKIMSILLTLTLILGLLPVTAAADGGSATEVWVGGTNVVNGDNITYWLNGSDGGIDSTDADEENYNVKFDPNEGKPTLTLREASIMKSYTVPSGVFTGSKYGIYSNVELELVIVGDNNRVISEDVSDKSSAGIYVYPGNLMISGSGTLTVYGGKGSFSYGIFIGSGDLTVESGNLVAGGENDATQKSCGIELQGNGHLIIKNGSKVTASGGKTAYPSYGVISTNPTGKIIVESGGKLSAKGGSSTLSNSYGIHSTSLDINGELTAIGASAGTYSYGIRGNNITISSGAVVSAVGSIATNKSYGILVGNNPGNKISINGGEVTVYAQSHAMDIAPDVSGFDNLQVTASENYTGTPTTQYKSDSIGDYKYLKFGPDNTSPTVTSVSVPPEGDYSNGHTLDFTVNFDENVTVDTTNGTPYIVLTVGSITKQTVYVSGSGTQKLVFRYTVNAGDSDSDGVSIDSLILNGGTIQDAAGNNANLTLNDVNSTAGIRVNPLVAPSITSHPSSQTVTEGQSATFSVTANGTGLIYQWQVNTGSGFTNISNGPLYSDAMTATLTITGVTAGMNGYQYRAIISGTAAPVATSNSATLTVNAAPSYTITANPTTKDFGSLTVGYTAPAAQTVTITNTGNSSVTLTQPTSTNYTIGTLSYTTLAANGTATFTVAPKAGLAVGNYDETLTVSTDHSTNATVELSFSVTAAPTYTITFNPNGGSVSETSRSVASGTAVGTLPTPTRSGSYSFDGWYTAASGGTQISASTTVSANVTYYAHWTYAGGGGSGSGGGSSSNDNSSPVIVTPPAPDKPNSPTQGEIKVSGTVDSKGNVTVNISDKTVTDAFEKALMDAKKNGNEQNGITVILRVDTGSKTGSNVTVNLPKTVQDTIIEKKIVNTIVVVDNPDIRIGMDLATVQEINRQAKSDVNITATRGDSSKLTGDAKKAIGSRPLFDLKVNYGNGKAVSRFGAGSVSVTIPYTLGANEKAGNVQAVYVDESGKVQWLINSVYDSLNRVLRFSTNHFSTYGVGYKQDAPTFTDIGSHWAKDDIGFVVNRGLFSGTSNTTFSPNTAMTRGMFVTALGRLVNADVNTYAKSSFSDVKNDAYYMGYIEWTSKNSIVAGIGDGKFAPDQSITREQLAVIMSNYAKTIGFTLPKVHAENAFTDNAKISAYAKDAVKQMQMAGVISGKNGNLFDPQGVATRAEVSAVLRRFVELAISSDTMQGWTMNDSGKWMYYENGKPITGKKNIDGSTYTFDQYGMTADVPKNLKYTTYTVQKGDSFWLIAHKLGCTMSELERLNNKSRFDLIHPDDVLRVPEK